MDGWRDELATAAVDLVAKYGFDGIDMDVEFERTNRPQASSVTTFLQTLRSKLPDDKLLIYTIQSDLEDYNGEFLQPQALARSIR